jgi:hypothetical protein
MGQQALNQDDLRLYLLGLLPPERQQPLEELFLTDSASYEELLIAEEDLIDEYLAGGLAERERAIFEARIANTQEGGREVRFASALRAYVASNTAAAGERPAEPAAKPEPGAETPGTGGGLFARLFTRGPVPALSLAAALLLVCGGVWLAVRTLRPDEPREVLTALLTPGGVTRADGDVQQVVVPAGTNELRLRLRLTADGFQSYRATLHTADGTTALTAERLKPEKETDGEPFVVVSVPAHDAPPGDYQLRLSGINDAGDPESVDSYRFRVVGR